MQTIIDSTPATKRRRLTPEERLARMGERYLKMRAKGGSYYDRAKAIRDKMISAGLMVGQRITIGDKTFTLKNNFVPGKPAGKYCMIDQFELVECAKNPRKKVDAEPAPLAEAA